jgi:nucleoid-associated protein YgaU
LRLKKNKEVVTIGRVTFGKDGKLLVNQDRHYQVKHGDTLYSIAKAQLGDSKLWESIVKANPGLDPKKLKIGTIITLPPK